MKFTWDKRKAASNEKKHGVSFSEASSVFGDQLALGFEDPYQPANEVRFLIFGVSGLNRLLTVSFTERQDSVRIISPRTATKSERGIYENG
jgi:hypothetical protein